MTAGRPPLIGGRRVGTVPLARPTLPTPEGPTREGPTREDPTPEGPTREGTEPTPDGRDPSPDGANRTPGGANRTPGGANRTSEGGRRAIPAQAWVGVAPLVAVAAVGLGLALGWRGVDMAAAVHRVDEFRLHGFLVWDDSWYGGQWTLAYSVVFAPVASFLGLHLLALLAAAVAALAFERLVTPFFGPAARVAAIVFALGTVVETSIGQLSFLSGEALALCALWAATRRRWPLAWALATGAALLSPLAGAFLALAAGSWLLTSYRSSPRRRRLAVLGVMAAVAVPLAVTAVLFPGEGSMPFSGLDCFWDLVIAGAILVLIPRRERTLRIGTAVYGVALVASWAISSPVGNNAGRLEDAFALPVAVLLLWPRRRWLVLGGIAVPLVLSSWGPAWGAMTRLPSQPEAQAAFYAPLDAWLARTDPDGSLGRVEVVPTQQHWEAVWVAGVEPLSRGWERQSDIAANPIFYRPGALTPASYRSWLLGDGVAFVALPAAPLDFAARAEGRLLAAGMPGLQPVWGNADWRVWAVTGSTGVVVGPATVVAVEPQRIVLRADRAAVLTVRVASGGHWTVTGGAACAEPGTRWTRVDVARPGIVVLSVALRSSSGGCG
jgi:hypothetical protein